MNEMYSDKIVPQMVKVLSRASSEKNSASSRGVVFHSGGTHSASALGNINKYSSNVGSNSTTSANGSQNIGTLGAIGSVFSTIFG